MTVCPVMIYLVNIALVIMWISIIACRYKKKIISLYFSVENFSYKLISVLFMYWSREIFKIFTTHEIGKSLSLLSRKPISYVKKADLKLKYFCIYMRLCALLFYFTIFTGRDYMTLHKFVDYFKSYEQLIKFPRFFAITSSLIEWFQLIKSHFGNIFNTYKSSVHHFSLCHEVTKIESSNFSISECFIAKIKTLH